MAGRIVVASALLLCLEMTPYEALSRAQSPDLYPMVQQVFDKHCGECHGKGKRVRGDLDLWNDDTVFKFEREWKGKPVRAVVPGDVSKSLIVIRMLDDKKPMPPKSKGALPRDLIEVVRRWIAAGAPTKIKKARKALPSPPDTRPIEEIVRGIFDNACVNCHSGSRPKGGLRILDYGSLIKKKLVVPKSLEQSGLYARIIAAPQDPEKMPPVDSGYALKPDEIRAIENWILRGSPPFDQTIQANPKQLGRSYVWKTILEDVRKMNAIASEDVPFARYVSFNHLVAAGITQKELDDHGKALALALNHLSWLKILHKPVSIDPPLNSIYRIDIRKLGLDEKPFTDSDVTLYDLVLLEYPYGVFDNGDATFRSLVREFLSPAKQAVPIAYVHGDWLMVKALQSPLYEDLLQLPLTIDDLEKRLGVGKTNLENFKVVRAGMSVSGVSRNNRIVERHPSKVGLSYYWKSFDFRSSRGEDNIFRNPIDLKPAGGEMIWSLPNGLQGYFVTDGSGNRISEAPTSIVTDEFASDQIVRNGLGCIRCHAHGMQPVRDDVNPFLQKLRGDPFAFNRLRALRLYPGAEKVKQLVARDSAVFNKALEKLFGKGTTANGAILRPITQRYLDQSISGVVALAEAGMDNPVGSVASFKTRGMVQLGLLQLANNGLIRRDAWEDLYDRVVEDLILGESMRPFDAITRLDFTGADAPEVVLKTNKESNLFRKGDEPVIIVENKSTKPIFCEVIGFGGKGNKFELTKRIAENAVAEIKAGEKLELKLKKVGDTFGKETVVLFASSQKFEPGSLLQLDGSAPGVRTAPRIVHRWYAIENGRIVSNVAPRFFVKKSITVETR